MSDLLRLLIAYLAGSIPIGLIVGKLIRKIDIRDYGSGNIGASNAWRTLGPRWGVLVFVLDVCKGLMPVIAAHRAPHVSAWTTVLTGLAAIMGHNFSPFLKFRGGKGVATSLGVCLGLNAPAALTGFAAWALVLAITRYISVSSIVAAPIACYLIWFWNGRHLAYGLFGILATLFVIVKHRSNMRRLQAGTEPKVGKKNPNSLSPSSKAAS